MNDKASQVNVKTERPVAGTKLSNRLFQIARSWLAQSAVLVLATLIVYRYAFFDVARADQLIYLYRTVDIHSLWNLTIGAYDFNRTLTVGDYILFRPLLYMLLGLERWLWGYDFLGWQATSIGLHIAIVLSLFCYFRYVCRRSALASDISFAPFVVTLFFALLYAGTELVAWEQIVGYLLFCLLAIQALFAYQRILDSRDAWNAILVVLFSGLACFTYELGSVLAGLLAVALITTVILERWWTKVEPTGPSSHRTLVVTASLLFVLPVAYSAWSFLNYIAIFGAMPHQPPLTNPRVIGLTLKSIGAWALSIFVPGSFILSPGSRITSLPAAHIPLMTSAIAGLIAICSLILVGYRRATFAIIRNGLPALVAFLFTLAYTVVISAGRGVPRGLSYVLVNNSYYAYIFALFILLGLFHVVVATTEAERTPVVAWARRIILMSFCAVAIISGVKVYQLHKAQYRTFSGPTDRLITKIEALKAKHRGERDFSFSLAPDCASRYTIPWFAIYALEKRSHYTIAFALFPHQAQTSGGKYIVHCPARPLQKWSSPSLLVQGFHGFNIIGFDGAVYAIPQSGGPFELSRITAHGYRQQYAGRTISSVEVQVIHSLSTH